MPVKRRITKAREQLDREEMDDHFYGPGTSLLNGCGYCGQVTGIDRFESLTERDRERVLDAMRVDWERHAAKLLTAWQDRDENDLYCARTFHDDPAEPWSLTQFGRPA